MRGRLIAVLVVALCVQPTLGALPTYRASVYVPPSNVWELAIPYSGDLVNYTIDQHVVTDGGVPVHSTSFGVPVNQILYQAIPGVYRTESGGTTGNGFVYQRKFTSFQQELGWGITKTHGVSPNGYITGSNYWSDGDGGGGSYGFGYNPITKHSFQVELGKFTQCRGGNSKGQFIFETDGFEDDYLGGTAVMYDFNTKEFTSLGQTFRPHTILENGTVYGYDGYLYIWSKEKGLQEIFEPGFNGPVIESVTQEGRVFAYGLSPGGGTSRDAGMFIYQDGNISRLIDLVPEFDKSVLELGGGHQTPEGVIFTSAWNKTTKTWTSYRLDPVPEPASLLVLGLGVAALRRKSAKNR